jgi:hypothetical protein
VKRLHGVKTIHSVHSSFLFTPFSVLTPSSLTLHVILKLFIFNEASFHINEWRRRSMILMNVCTINKMHANYKLCIQNCKSQFIAMMQTIVLGSTFTHRIRNRIYFLVYDFYLSVSFFGMSQSWSCF